MEQNKLVGLMLMLILLLAVPLTIFQLNKKTQDSRSGATGESSLPPTQFGMQIDVRDPQKVPSPALLAELNPAYLRFVFPCVNASSLSLTASQLCPNDWHSVNLLGGLTTSAKLIAIVTGDSGWGAPIGSSSESEWGTYIDTTYVPTVRQIVSSYGERLSAIQIWNEQDHAAGDYNPYISPRSYAYMLSRASSAIKETNPNLQIITGGLAGANSGEYMRLVKEANPQAFARVDAIGLHPYQPPAQVANISAIVNNLASSLRQNGIQKPVWVTEIGIQEYTETNSPKNQEEFLQNAFTQFQTLNTPLVVWYAYTDAMIGGDGSTGWGLVDNAGNLKPSGRAFRSFTNPSSPTPTPTPTPVPPTAVPTPTPIEPGPTTISSCTPPTLPSPVPNTTELAFSLTLSGIGPGSNPNPRSCQKQLVVQVFNQNETRVGGDETVDLSYDPSSGTFVGVLDVSAIPSGAYLIKIKAQKYLRKLMPGAHTFGTGGRIDLPITTLIVGNSNILGQSENAIDIQDFNMLVGCFGAKADLSSCGGNKDLVDFDDNGVIDGIDLNLLIRSLTTRNGD